MRVILVVGPSGSGKDTLLRSAREHFAEEKQFAFVRRYITRLPDRNEDNYFLDPAAFTFLSNASFFISTWRSHDNFYGIPYHALNANDMVKVSVCSVSRSAIGDFERRYAHTTTILVTAQEEVLRQRLQKRGREDDAAVRQRLARADKAVVARDLIVFDNFQSLEYSAALFVELLESLGGRVVRQVTAG